MTNYAVPAFVYRSTASDLIEAIQEAEAKLVSFKDDCYAWADANKFDDQDREVMMRYDGMTLDRWCAGITRLPNDDTVYRRRVSDAPFPGWKFNRESDLWVPDKRTEQGQRLLDTRPYVSGNTSIAARIADMPLWITVSRNEHTGATRAGSADISLIDGIVTAECPGDPHERRQPSAKFLEYWTPVKLSEYLAEQGR